MISHFKHIEFQFSKASMQIPNSLFEELSSTIKGTGKSTVSQVAMAYTYLVAVGFLYKYTNYVDLMSGTYIQNKDLKEILGYHSQSKSIDSIIAKGGVLEKMGLVESTRDYPVSFYMDNDSLTPYPTREFLTISDLRKDDILYERIKAVVKNRNYTVKEPIYFLGSEEREGTMMHYENTHKITIQEFIHFVEKENFSNTDFYLYAYLKSKCFGKSIGKSVPLARIVEEAGISRTTFYPHLHKLVEDGCFAVSYGKWKKPTPEKFTQMNPNYYYWKGVTC